MPDPAPMPDRVPDANRAVLLCGVLIDGTGSAPRENMAVLVDGARVSAVLPWSAFEGLPRVDSNVAVPIADYRDATVVPGLIDGHAHLCWGSPRSPGWLAVGDQPASIVGWGLSSCVSALAAGITTVVDCGSRSGLALTVRDLVRAGIACGPRVLAAGEAITTTAGHGRDIGITADDAAGMRGAVRDLVARSADLVKIMVTGGATDPHTNRRQPQYSTQELRAAIEDAHRLGRRVVGHANATEGIVRAVEAGIDIVAHCNWLGAEPGTVVLDLPTIKRMAQDGVFVDLNVQGARRPLAETDGVVVDWAAQDDAQPGCRWQLLEPMRQEGIAMYLTSDAFGPAIGSFPEQLGRAGSEWGLGAEELISRVTAIPAQAFGLSDRGMIAAGCDADITVYDGDLRTDWSTLSRPLAVHQRGRLVVSRGRLSPPRIALAHAGEARAQDGLIDDVFRALD